ncbi:MAG TPA: hypothetical protein VG456_08425 [Candidatus Sulfopaludibacter sp.]|jgi:hypothetical protein|nr:hypothetical protein [Candidatus Sulfopaludibacter sp.]
MPDYANLAQDYVAAYDEDEAALLRLNTHYGRSFSIYDLHAEIWRRNYALRQRSSHVPKNFLKLEEAQLLLAQDAGYSSWAALTQGGPRVAPFDIDDKEGRAAPRRRLNDAEWDELIGLIGERGIASVSANGLMTDGVLGRIASLACVTRLQLGGSRELSDDGLLHLARMGQLQHLELSEYPGGKLTDRGLEVLQHLPDLRHFEMTWQAGITDAGLANLRYCDRLERVDVMGSPTGDGVIAALQGKPNLAVFHTGRLVTDAGLSLLKNFPALANLLIDGPFTDDGLAELAGMDALTDLDLFWNVTGITAQGFAHLRKLPNLESLGCDGNLADDAALRYIGEMPSLRKLRAQEAAATDTGFEALAASRTLEGFWGGECPNFGSRAFLAFSQIATLRRLGVSLHNVDAAALSALPRFPSLRELTPIGLKDDDFRYVGECRLLERLTCMYCRETTDLATEHIAGLPLKYYYAGLTQITDRSLEILGRISSLEQVELYECLGVTDAGLPALAALPNLREVSFNGLPGVTLEGTAVFPPSVRVNYTT